MQKPKKIYKYQSISQYSLRNLKNNHIYFNSPRNFNDPFDTFQEVKIKDLSEARMKDTFWGKGKVRKVFELMENGEASIENTEIIYTFLSNSMDLYSNNLTERLKFDLGETSKVPWENIIKNSDSEEKLQKAICKTFYDSFNDIVKTSMQIIKEQGVYEVSVSCFSEENDNMLMWSHYADGHKGFCLEFDTNYDPFTKMFPVSYSENIPEIDANKIINNPDNYLETIKANLLHKYIDWRYEKEWRVLHQEKTTSFCYKTNALTGVYFGTKIDFSDLEIIATIIKGQHLKCKFYLMDKVSGAFKVVPRMVNYSTFSEAKNMVTKHISTQLEKGEVDVEQLMNKVELEIPQKQIRTIIEAILDDMYKST